jgi:hypothetical protein
MVIVYTIEADGKGYYCGWDVVLIGAFDGMCVWLVPGTYIEHD